MSLSYSIHIQFFSQNQSLLSPIENQIITKRVHNNTKNNKDDDDDDISSNNSSNDSTVASMISKGMKKMT